MKIRNLTIFFLIFLASAVLESRLLFGDFKFLTLVFDFFVVFIFLGFGLDVFLAFIPVILFYSALNSLAVILSAFIIFLIFSRILLKINTISLLFLSFVSQIIFWIFNFLLYYSSNDSIEINLLGINDIFLSNILYGLFFNSIVIIGFYYLCKTINWSLTRSY